MRDACRGNTRDLMVPSFQKEDWFMKVIRPRNERSIDRTPKPASLKAAVEILAATIAQLAERVEILEARELLNRTAKAAP